jgi:hypothetical protein
MDDLMTCPYTVSPDGSIAATCSSSVSTLGGTLTIDRTCAVSGTAQLQYTIGGHTYSLQTQPSAWTSADHSRVDGWMTVIATPSRAVNPTARTAKSSTADDRSKAMTMRLATAIFAGLASLRAAPRKVELFLVSL